MNTTPDRRQYSHANDRSPTGSNEPWAIPVSDFISQAERNYGRDSQTRAMALPLILYPRPLRAFNAQVIHPRPTFRALLRTVRYIHGNLDSKLTWERLASAVGVDLSEFGRGFKMSTGVTPHQYVIGCRLRRAVKLLQCAEMGIADIALEVGRACQSHLTTLFGKYLGTTPGALRKAVKV